MAQEVKPTTTAPAFVWKIKNFSTLTHNKLYSDAFVVGRYKWRLLLFPKGNKVDDHLSLYLDVADSSKLPDGWSIDIESFSITVVNKIRFEYSVAKASKHRFHATEGDWGFTSFMPLEKLHDPNLGFLIDNTLVIGAHLSISAPPSPHLSYNDRASRFIKMVHFRSLDTPMEDGFCLELLTLNTYDDVVETVANRIGFDDPSKIRLTSHNCYSHQPNPEPIKYRGVDQLSDMLLHFNQTSDILYYEVLDTPLPELQGLKSLKVAFHDDAMKDEKLMAQQVKPTTVKSTSFSWVIKNFTNSKTKKLYSDVFLAFGYKWRLFVDPKGNIGNVLWVYLEVVDFAKLPSDWSIKTQLDLTLVNQILKEDSIKEYGKCKFCAGQTDWGFPYFLPLTELSKGYLVNDTVILEIDVSEESTLRKLNIFAESTSLFQMPTPPDTPSVSFASSSMSSQPSSTLLKKSKNILTELSILKITGKSTSASSSGISGSAMQQERKALKHYLALPLEAIDQANGFNEIEKITLLLLQHSANSHERTILRHFVSRVAALKEIVPATKSSIENVRAQNMSLVGKKADLRARLKQGQERLCSLEVQLSKLLQEKRELEEDVVFLMTEEGEPRRMNLVALELEKMNQKVSKDIEEWREISKEAEQAANQWLQAREKLAQANLSWQLFKQNLELCEN